MIDGRMLNAKFWNEWCKKKLSLMQGFKPTATY